MEKFYRVIQRKMFVFYYKSSLIKKKLIDDHFFVNYIILILNIMHGSILYDSLIIKAYAL